MLLYEVIWRFCVPFTHFPPTVTSCKMIQYHYQDFDIDTDKLGNISITIKDPFYRHTHLSPSPPSSLVTLNLFSISRILHFKMLYKWNYTGHNLWGWVFSLSIILWGLIQVVACIGNYFYCWVVFHGMDVSQFVSPVTR